MVTFTSAVPPSTGSLTVVTSVVKTTARSVSSSVIVMVSLVTVVTPGALGVRMIVSSSSMVRSLIGVSQNVVVPKGRFAGMVIVKGARVG